MSPDRVSRVVAAHLPDYRVDSVVRLGAGLDNVAYEVNGELIVRFAREPDRARVDREARLLTVVAGISPLPVPEPAFTDPDQGCLAYAKVPGVPLLSVLPGGRARGRPPGDGEGGALDCVSIATTLGELLAALHAVPVDRMAGLVDTDDLTPADWRREAEETYAEVAGHVPAVHRRPVEAFLECRPPEDAYPSVFSHNDLGIEHVLVHPVAGKVTGVIDWSDAAITDPAFDFGLVYRDLGPAALDAALRGYGTAGVGERAAFYARCSVFEDLAYGLETGRQRYIDKSLAAMSWLFPPRPRS